MYKFGKIPPRAIDSMGVASVLAENCQVFYDNLFSAAGLGRVSDLLAARLRSQGLDELKLRAVLLFGFFEAFHSQSQGGALDEPLVIECGVDEEKVAVGVAFHFQNASDLKTDGLVQRISENKPQNAFEILLSVISTHSDQAILRVDESSHKVEVISLLAIPGKCEVAEKQPLVIITPKTTPKPADAAEATDSESASPRVEAKVYIQLGDLDYLNLLEEKAPKQPKKKVFSTGEILEKRFSAQPAAKNQNVHIVKEQKDEEDDSKVHISTAEEKKEEKVFRFSRNDTLNEVKDEDKSEGGGALKAVKNALGKVWPFKRKDKEEGESEQVDVASGQAVVKAPEEQKTKEKAKVSASEAEPEKNDREVHRTIVAPLPDFEETDVKGMTQYLSSNVSSGSFSKLVERTQEMARDLKRSPEDTPVKRWMEGFSQEILAEKVRLVELSKKVTQAIRQKEQELKHREQQFADDLRRKEEANRQKTAALARAKERIAQLTAQLERQKGSKGASGEENNFKQKYQLSQRMVTGLRDENTKLKEKLEELKAQAVSAQKSSESSAQVELANLKSKHDQLVRQNMQLKSMNEQFMRRMKQDSDKSVAEKEEKHRQTEEVKKKLDAALALADTRQKELAKKDSDLRAAKTALENAHKMLSTMKKAG